MNNASFHEILSEIQPIPVELNWIGNEGCGDFESEIHTSHHSIVANYECYEHGIYDPGDYFTAPYFTTDGLQVVDIEIKIYNECGDELTLSLEQIKIISNKIELSLNSI